MGQPIQITRSTVVGENLVLDTDRSVSGQDGAAFTSAEEAAGDALPARLARRLFDEVPGVNHVFAASNLVVVGRDSGWDQEAVDRATTAVARFFVFYE